jgi:hypothetical protein
MPELIVIKTGEKYFRCNEGEHSLCSLEKASVFPLAKLDHVRDIVTEIESRGYPDVHLNKLVITETPFIPEEER